ncbi:CDP-paratose 2-epimerase [candidate division MSBL1 archaeon SCGC-AAA385M11]|nr:CDP-paratose 2-epimerase [candidate division MSBL1 archaeon SCGC-AAA385M11]
MQKQIIITGGAGFIGTNAVLHFSQRGWKVIVLDNLSRNGAYNNLEYLKKSADFEFFQVDIRKQQEIEDIFKKNSVYAILHLAGQVAVTTSVINPRDDFNINAYGSFNVLEAVRKFAPEALFLNASTNKVYGKMLEVEVIERNGRYEYKDYFSGIDETFPLDFHSPYGCSKGTADQYTIDYHRIYGMPTTTFRQSCIYGPNQYGIEDQGWLAWFTIATLLKKPISIYGDGKQIRDVLYVNDLLTAYELAINNPDAVAGQSFNIGGGPNNTLSVLELLNMLTEKQAKQTSISYDDWRPGDQKVFVCNTSKAKNMLKWEPQFSVDAGFDHLYNWILDNLDMIRSALKG